MFKFFKDSKDSQPTQSENASETVLEARAHHFTMSQVVIPQVAWRDPMTFFGAIKMDQTRFVDYLCKVNRDINQKNRDDFRLQPEDLSIKTTVIHPYPCIVMKMPPPNRVGESYFVAVILYLDPKLDDSQLDPKKGPSIGIFNLDFESQQRTQIIEWQGEQRVLHGPGPQPGEDHFLRWIAAHLASGKGKP